MNNEVLEALRSAQELFAYLWNNTDANDPEAGNVGLVAHSAKHAEQLAALLNDARTRVDAALHGLESQGADVGKTADYPRLTQYRPQHDTDNRPAPSSLQSP